MGLAMGGYGPGPRFGTGFVAGVVSAASLRSIRALKKYVFLICTRISII